MPSPIWSIISNTSTQRSPQSFPPGAMGPKSSMSRPITLGRFSLDLDLCERPDSSSSSGGMGKSLILRLTRPIFLAIWAIMCGSGGDSAPLGGESMLSRSLGLMPGGIGSLVRLRLRGVFNLIETGRRVGGATTLVASTCERQQICYFFFQL